MDTTAQDPVLDDEIRLSEYLAALRRARWRVLVFVIACTLATTTIGFLLPRKYTAVIVVAPVTNAAGGSRLGGLSGMVSQLGGLASLAGISLGEDTERAEILAVLESAALTERYIAQNNLLPVLFRKQWDPQTRQWKVTTPQKMPTLWKANQLFDKTIRVIATDPKSGIVTMKITWTNAAEAATWANGLVAMTNDYLRTKAIAEADRNISYLNEQAEKTNLVQVRQAIYTILETEINKEMLARGTEEYALKVLDPAQSPERPSSLSHTLWLLLGLFGSTGLALVSIFFRIAWSPGG